jgi:protein-L-isoaspartate(D-aspartate) O-methyltransferase
MKPDGAHPTDDASADPPLARALRERLVHTISASVKDPSVLAAMRAVPRHRFVLSHPLESAYEDHPLTIGHDATISQPSLVAIMTAALELHGDERVLEVGTGSGYQAAVLARLAGHVDTVEVVPDLAVRAARILFDLGCANVDVHTGDGWSGWPTKAPYDRVVVTAAPDVVPTALLEQLTDGGFLVIPVGSQATDQRLQRLTKHGSDLKLEDLGAVRFVPMVHR